MQVSSFTNAVGSYFRDEVFTNRFDGVIYGTPVHQRYDDVVRVALSVKPAPVKGDHKSPMPYYRRIVNMSSNSDWSSSYILDGGQVSILSSGSVAAAYPPAHIAPPDGAYSDFENNEAKVRTQVLNKIHSAKLSNGAAIGEARKSLNMAAELMDDVLSAVKAVRRGNWYLALKNLGATPKEIGLGHTLSRRWLEFVYGWTPTMGDIVGNLELARTAMRKEGAVFIASSASTSEWSESPYKGPYYTTQWKVTNFSHAKIYFKVVNTYLERLDAMGLINPFEIAWELVPFSFIVDWFVPVGNMLSGFSAPIGTVFDSGYQSSSMQGSFSASAHNAPYGNTLHNGGGLQVEQGEFFRKLMFGYPTPELYADTSPFSTKRTANALALLRQLL